MRIFAIGTAVLALLFGASEAAGGEFNPEYPASDAVSYAVTAFAGKRTYVYCEEMPRGYYGYTYLNGNEIFLSHRFCNPLNALAGGEYVAVQRQGVAIETLTHETLHTLGMSNEAKTECWALQMADEMMLAFGVVDWMIPVLWHHAWVDNVKNFRRLEKYWNPRKCRPNGAWDRTPGDGRWP